MFNSCLSRIAVLVPCVIGLVGCQNAPGTRAQQGAVVGGAAGAATGAAVAKGNRGLGAVIGGVLGAAGGYVIAGKTDPNNPNNPAEKDRAVTASQNSQARPASAEEARTAATADINRDGFVTLDEVVALRQAGFGDQQIVQKLQATGQIFQLNAEQEQYLTDRGISRYVLDQMRGMNQSPRQGLNDRQDVISR